MRSGGSPEWTTPPGARRALAVGAALALAALAAVLAGEPASRARLPLALALLATPVLHARLERRWAALRTRESLLVVLLAQLGGIALLLARAPVWWAAALLQASARGRSPGAAALGGVLALGSTVVALREAPSPVTLLAPFAVSLCVVPALLAIAAHGARTRLRRARVALPSAPTELCIGWRAAVFTWPVLLAGLLLSARWTTGLGAGLDRTGESASAEQESRAESQAEDALATRWSERMSFGEGVGRLSDEVVLWAQPRGRPLEQLYLAVLALDQFDERSLGQPRLDQLRLVSDGDDGTGDGRIEFGSDAAEHELEVRVVQRPLRVGGLGTDALARIEPLLWLDLPRVLYEPDTALVLPGESQVVVEYSFGCVAPDRRAPVPKQARARHVDPRYTQLPPDSPALRRLGQIAEAWLSDAPGDRALVERLLERFGRDFSYSLEGSGFAGVEGALAFLQERAGYCTSFASTAVLLLRSRGIACRAVGGYLADEWDAERGAFAVRGRDAHAWIEVHFEGLGWRAFDPTPALERERAFLRREGSLAPEVSEWSSALLSSLVESAGSGSAGAGLARLGANLAQAPAVLRQEVLDLSPSARVVLLCGLVLAALGALWLGRSAHGGAAGAGTLSGLSRGPYEKLLAQLALRGFSPARSESLRAFARRVESAQILPGFRGATEAHLAERFGGQVPDRAARANWDTLLTLLRRDPAVRT